MANPKTFMLLLYLILYSGLSKGDLDPGVVENTEAVFGAVGEFSSILETVSDLTESLQEITEKAAETLSKIVEVVGTLSKVASAFSVFGSLLSIIFAFIPQEDPMMEFLKEEFAEVNRKLDALAYQISNLQKDVRWTAYASVYSKDESNIQNSWKKLQELMENAPLAKTKQDKVRMAERFTRFYEDTATENSVRNFYSYLTVRGTSLKENLLDLVLEKFKGDFKVMVRFSSHFTGLMLKGLQLNLYYYALRGYNGEKAAKEAAELMSNVVSATQEAMIQCIENFEKFAAEDIKEIGTGKFSNTKSLALTVQRHLEKKFSWYDWMVLVYGKDSSHFDDLHNIHVSNNDVIIFYREKGTKANEYEKRNILNIWDRTHVEICTHGPEATHKIIRYKLNKYTMKYINRIHVVDDPQDYAITDDDGSLKLQCAYKKVIMFLKSREVADHTPCSTTSCQHGKCIPIKDTRADICRCDKMFYGPTCEESVENDLKWSVIQSTIDSVVVQPVPDLTAIYFSIQDLKQHTQHLANALQSDIKWTQIFVNYGDIISILRYFVKQHQFLQKGTISNQRYVQEVKIHLQQKTFRYLTNKYNNLMMGTGFGDKSNILDTYRGAILLEKNSAASVACSKAYVDSVDQFVRYMFALEKESQLAWFKYLLLTSSSIDTKQEENIFKHHVQEQWKLYNRNGCGPLKALHLCNKYCVKPYHSTANQKVSVKCAKGYRAYPETVQCSGGKWSALPVCYKPPIAKGMTTCRSENGKTVCEARCISGWSFPDGKTSFTSTCSEQPCKSFTPTSCTKCTSSRVCADHEVCKAGTCVDGCLGASCGRYAECYTTAHAQKCKCKPGYSGDPYKSCNYRDPIWVSTTGIPSNTVKSSWGRPVCRTKGPDGAYHGGWIYNHWGNNCNYFYNWKEYTSKKFEVLTDPCRGKGVEWKSGAFHSHTVPVGSAADGRDGGYYVCSCHSKRVPGKLSKDGGRWYCYTGFGGGGWKVDLPYYSLVQLPCA